ncbi:MAG: sigma-54-dependent Fis family transcriptional regulator, partial [Caulobacteraceae bacterium]|nr:sigma-54-dependent Fis family transcriptional regulator [Caulobacter sp.]
DPALSALLRRAVRLHAAGLPVLLRGETGTGKEHVAKALHAASARAGKPFVPVNCAALPDAMIEPVLFGTEGRAGKGLVQQADGGTLFLDEIGDMPLLAQTRLLRVLAEREVAAVGGRPRPVDLQVIAATHRDLRALVRDGGFRQDLYFRLNGAVFDLPPLRERRDLDWLIDRLLAPKPCRTVSAAARAALHHHDWPGNVRELVHALDYAAALAAGDEIGPGDLPPLIADAAPRDAPMDVVETALRRNRWNVSAAARELRLDRTTVHRRIRKLGLVAPNKAPNG